MRDGLSRSGRTGSRNRGRIADLEAPSRANCWHTQARGSQSCPPPSESRTDITIDPGGAGIRGVVAEVHIAQCCWKRSSPEPVELIGGVVLRGWHE